MFFYIVLTPISTTSGLWSTGNTRKYHQIDVYIYQCVSTPVTVTTRRSTRKSNKESRRKGTTSKVKQPQPSTSTAASSVDYLKGCSKSGKKSV